jgi:hypothetical protein
MSSTSGSNGSNRIGTSSLKTIVLQSTAVVTKFISNTLIPKAISSRIVGSSGIGGSSGTGGRQGTGGTGGRQGTGGTGGKNGTVGSSGYTGTSTPTINLNQNVTTDQTKLDLFSHISSNFDNLIKEKKDKNIMTPYGNPYNWPRNNNCWAKSIDLTGYAGCVVPLGGVGGGTLITKKHILLANHVPYSASPFMIFFVNNNNVSLIYNVVKTKRVGDTDILIGELDKEVDDSLKVCSVLPANYIKYFDKQSNFPLLYSDQERKALIGEHGLINNTFGSTNTLLNIPKDPNKAQYFEAVIGGDSGNLVSTIINNELVLIGGLYMTFGDMSGLATSVPSYINEVNNTISSLSSGYKVNEVDLSQFKTY